MGKIKTLFLSYNGLLEPILPSQAVPYLEGLAKEGFRPILLTYEKNGYLKRIGKSGIATIKKDLKGHGIEWHFLRYHKHPPLLSTIFDLCIGFFYSFYFIIVKKARIVHARGITPGAIVIALSRLVSIKVLFDMRGLLAEEYVGGGLWKEGSVPFRLVKKAENMLLMSADAITVLTKKHFELYGRFDCIAKRNIPMNVIPCCVDMARFSYGAGDDLRRSLGLENKFVLMYPGKIGTFYLVKEMLDFFRCMRGVMAHTVFFVVTNDSPRGLIVQAKTMNIDPDTMVIARDVPFERMPQHIRSADAGIFFINPYKKIGSSPIKLGEFLASGVPVIINPGIGDTESIVRDNRVGVVVKDFDEHGYTSAITELLTLKQEKEDLKRRCREAAEKHFSLEKGVSTYVGIYRVLSGAAQ